MSGGPTCSPQCRWRRTCSRSVRVEDHRSIRGGAPAVMTDTLSAEERARFGCQEATMNVRRFLVLGLSVLASFVCGLAIAAESQPQYVQVAEIEIDPAQLENY